MNADLTGQRFGRLTVLGRRPSDKSGRIRWECLCDCGNKTIVAGTRLRKGASKSCGCYQRDAVRAHNLTHGETRQKPGEQRIPRIYRIWANMKTRCNNPNTPYYDRYGGRGIRVCPEWTDSFEAFHAWAISAGYDDAKEIDRIDNDGDYTPENCRWVPHEAQQNNKENTVRITHAGQTRTLSEWAAITGLKSKTIWQRLQRGKTPEEALTQTDKPRAVANFAALCL